MKRLYITITLEVDLIPWKRKIEDSFNGAEIGKIYKWLFIKIVYKNGK